VLCLVLSLPPVPRCLTIAIDGVPIASLCSSTRNTIGPWHHVTLSLLPMRRNSRRLARSSASRGHRMRFGGIATRVCLVWQSPSSRISDRSLSQWALGCVESTALRISPRWCGATTSPIGFTAARGSHSPSGIESLDVVADSSRLCIAAQNPVPWIDRPTS
jgi:hypothetical protein